MPVWVVEHTRPLLVFIGVAQITLAKQGCPKCGMGIHEQVRILRCLRNIEQSFTQFACS
ncbi:hypothetical protein D3C76_1054040 [compost metagenome]